MRSRHRQANAPQHTALARRHGGPAPERCRHRLPDGAQLWLDLVKWQSGHHRVLWRRIAVAGGATIFSRTGRLQTLGIVGGRAKIDGWAVQPALVDAAIDVSF